MKNIVLFLIAAAFLSSCVTQRACLEKFPPQVITKDSIVYKTTIVKHDTTIYVPIKGKEIHDSVKIEIPIEVPGKPVILSTKVLTKETQFAKASAYVKNNVLYLDIEQKTDSIKAIIKDAIQKETITHSEVKSKESTIVIKPKWKPDIWSLLIGCVLMLAALYGIAKFKK